MAPAMYPGVNGWQNPGYPQQGPPAAGFAYPPQNGYAYANGNQAFVPAAASAPPSYDEASKKTN